MKRFICVLLVALLLPTVCFATTWRDVMDALRDACNGDGNIDRVLEQLKDAYIFKLNDEPEGIRYEIIKGTEEHPEELAVVGYQAAHYYHPKELVIPETYKGIPVTAIKSMDDLCVLGHSGASYATKRIIIPPTIKTIYPSAFLAAVYVEEIVLNASITEIPAYAFSNCLSLQKINIPDSVVSIGDYAFQYCGDSLYAAEAPQIEFGSASNLKTIGNYAFQYARFKSLSIPDSVTHIGDYAFYATRNMTSIHLPDSLTDIGEYAFCDCSLTSVVIPAKVEELSSYAFSYCKQLTSVSFAAGSQLQVIGNNAFCGCKKMTSCPLPPMLKRIEDEAFEDCNELTNVVFPSGLTYIGKNGFESCHKFSTIVIPSSMTEIGDSFGFCNAYDIYIPSSITYIHPGAFITRIKTAERTIHCSPGSYAEAFAKKEHFNCDTSWR